LKFLTRKIASYKICRHVNELRLRNVIAATVSLAFVTKQKNESGLRQEALYLNWLFNDAISIEMTMIYEVEAE
jgi:hypothetical protein